MPPVDFNFWLQVLVESFTLFVLIVGLFGLLIPVFPGLTVMWAATFVYALVQAENNQMAWIDWTLFALITLLMIGGNIVDNIIIAKHVRDKQVPWRSILFGFAAGFIVSLFFTPLIGIVASPVGLYLAELNRLRDRNTAFANTKAWMTGWGWSVAARFGIGLVMLIFWMLWAWL
jgi:uncharacterized protein YqgC (DUF456 family)